MTNISDYVPVECVNIPKMLFREKQFEKLSVDAKLLYSLLLDRKNVAAMNGWVDQYGTAYVIYPKSEMKKHLNASRYRVDAALAELEKCDQMVVVTQPNPGRPCQIYVKDITGKLNENMEDKPMCMMMKEPNGKNEKECMGPCMGIPGMQGVAIFFDPEDFTRAMEAFGAEMGFADPEPDAAESESDKKERELMEALKADAQRYANKQESQEEDKQQSSFYDYKNDDYYALCLTERKLVDMTYRGYIDEDDEIDANAVYGDAMDLGDELGITLGTVLEDHPEDLEAITEFMTMLLEKKKWGQVKAVLRVLSIFLECSPEYLEDMDCCMGNVKKLYLNYAVHCMISMANQMVERYQKSLKEQNNQSIQKKNNQHNQNSQE